MSTTVKQPDEEVAADLYYIGAYANDLKQKLHNGTLTKADSALTSRMIELAGKVSGQINLRTGPW